MTDQAPAEEAEEAAVEEEPEPVHVGCTFVCRPDVADDLAQALRAAVEEILEQFSDDEIFDYGVD